MYKVGLILLFVHFSTILLSQNQHRADSLKEYYSNYGDQLSEAAKFEVLRKIVSYEGSRDQALTFGQLLLAVAESSNDKVKIAEALEELSLIHRTLGNITMSTKEALRAQSIYKGLGLIEREAASITQLASNLMLEERYGLSVDYNHKALNIFNEIADTIRISITTLNIGEAYRLQGQLDSAGFYTKRALNLNDIQHSRTYENQIVHGYAIGNLGLVYKAKGSLNQAQPLLEESIEVLTDLGDLYSVSVYSFELGDILIREGDHEGGEKRMLVAYATVLDEGFKEQIRDFSQSLASYYQSNGDFEEALHFQQQYQLYKDSLINIDNVRQVEQLKAQNEVSQRDAEISLLNQARKSQQQMVIGLSAGTLVLLLLLSLLYRNNQQKKKANVLLVQREKEKALLLQELNHRTKNNLQVISSLLNLQSMSLEDHPAAEKVREGRYRVDSLALIHQKLYQEDYAHLDMKQYLQELIDHLCASFDPLIRVETAITPCQMKVDQAIPVALIINELLTNALKYGLDPSKSIHQVWVTFQGDRDGFRLNIRDNGPGMLPPDVASLPSFGLQLVYSLVEQLEGVVNFESKEGTHWEISFA